MNRRQLNTLSGMAFGGGLLLAGTLLETDPALLDSFVMDGKPPRSVIVIAVDSVYFQCARAIIRAGLWDPARHVDPSSLPTPGQILAALSDGTVGGAGYDRDWPERASAGSEACGQQRGPEPDRFASR